MSGEDVRMKGMSEMQKQDDTFTMGEMAKDSNVVSALVSHAQSQNKINKMEVEDETEQSKHKESQGTNGMRQSSNKVIHSVEDEPLFIKSQQTEV